MSPEETLLLTRLVKGACPAQHIDEYTPDTWFEVLKRFTFADCEAALYAAAAASPFCSASDIAGRVLKVRAARLQGVDEIQPPSDLDPDDTAAYTAWQRRTFEAVANGQLETPKPLPAGRPSAQMLALVSGVGRRVPRPAP